jgi:hypothetical protein
MDGVPPEPVATSACVEGVGCSRPMPGIVTQKLTASAPHTSTSSTTLPPSDKRHRIGNDESGAGAADPPSDHGAACGCSTGDDPSSTTAPWTLLGEDPKRGSGGGGGVDESDGMVGATEELAVWIANGGGGIPAGYTGPPPIESIPVELLVAVFTSLDPSTLLLAVPAVCRQWRRVLPLIPNFHLDLTFLPSRAAMRRDDEDGRKVRWIVGLLTRHPQVSDSVRSGCLGRLGQARQGQFLRGMPHHVDDSVGMERGGCPVGG